MGLDCVTVVVEGETDKPVADRLLALVGLHPSTFHVMGGKAALDRRLRGYNSAARFGRWLVLRDLDHDEGCGPRLARKLVPRPSRGMQFRIAVREVEAWLMADGQALSRFLGINDGLVPVDTERLDDAKGALVRLARGSRLRSIRLDMVPAHGTSSRVGPGYAGRILEFTRDHWRPQLAARRNRSLAKCIAALRRWSRS